MLESLLSEYQLYSGLINKTSEARVEGLTATRDRAQQVVAVNIVDWRSLSCVILRRDPSATIFCFQTQPNPTVSQESIWMNASSDDYKSIHLQVNTLVGTATGKAVEEGEARGRVSRERQQLLQGDLLDKVVYILTCSPVE